MQKLKEGTDPFRQIYSVGDKILKIQETSDASILKYASSHPNQFAVCLESWQERGLYFYLFEKLDYVLNDMKLSQKQVYSMLIQVALIVRQLRKNNWVWWDLHDGNIGAVKCSGNIVIDGVTVPTYGYRFKIIDFGDFIHKSTKTKKQDYHHFLDVKNNGLDLWSYLVPSIGHQIAHETPKEMEQKNIFSFDSNVVKTAVFLALFKKNKINVPLDDILFFANHGLLSDESIVYMKKKL